MKLRSAKDVFQLRSFPANFNMCKVNNRNNKKMCKICSNNKNNRTTLNIFHTSLAGGKC